MKLGGVYHLDRVTASIPTYDAFWAQQMLIRKENIVIIKPFWMILICLT